MALGGAPSCSASATTYFCLTCCLVVMIESGECIGQDDVESVVLPKRFLESRRRRNLEAEAVTRIFVGASVRPAGGSARLRRKLFRDILPASVTLRPYILEVPQPHFEKSYLPGARSSDADRAEEIIE